MARADVRIVVQGLRGFLDRIVRKIVLDCVAELVPATPIDTGWARSNWVPRIGRPFDDVAGSYPGTGGTLNFGPQNSGLSTVAAAYKTAQGSVYITNNVPYITLLNEGFSKQAPKGFVRQALERAIAKVGER